MVYLWFYIYYGESLAFALKSIVYANNHNFILFAILAVLIACTNLQSYRKKLPIIRISQFEYVQHTNRVHTSHIQVLRPIDSLLYLYKSLQKYIDKCILLIWIIFRGYDLLSKKKEGSDSSNLTMERLSAYHLNLRKIKK